MHGLPEKRRVGLTWPHSNNVTTPLKVLEHPDIPLHTNASENDIRSFVTRRKISGGTISLDGRIAATSCLGC
ncbi:hypothetical protein AJ87_21620 [Rhizobium yanglingense]|nr:hypothetical protein AJ87_21620 [Rhizobium yanglingense]